MNRNLLSSVLIAIFMIITGCKVVISAEPPGPTDQPMAERLVNNPTDVQTIAPTLTPVVSPQSPAMTPTETVTITATESVSTAETTPTDAAATAFGLATITPSGEGQVDTSIEDLTLGSEAAQDPTATSTSLTASITPTFAATSMTTSSNEQAYEVSAASMDVAVISTPSAPIPSLPTPTPVPNAGTGSSDAVYAEADTNNRPTVRETIITIDTYGYKQALVPTTPDDPVYPYPRLNHDAVTPPLPQEYRAVILENDYLELTILPELGGRIFRWIDKMSGQNLFYENPVIKPTRWGNRGWWLATGGMEWALPTDEHGLSEAFPWEYSLFQAPDSAGVILTDTEERSGLLSEITISLDADHAYFSLRPRIANPTDKPVAYKFWLNGMFDLGSPHPGSGIDLVLPGNQVTVHSTGDPSLPGEGQPMDWPVFSGHDFSDYGNWTNYLGVFAAPTAQKDFMGAYNHQTNSGVARIFPHSLVRGAKIFGPGNLDPSLWTDDGSSYFELWGGLAPTFWDEVTLGPNEWVTWQEQWYAIGDMGGFGYANSEAALNMGSTDTSVQVAAASTYDMDGQLVLWQNGREAARWPLKLTPEQPFRVSFTPPEGVAGTWGLSLYDATGREVATMGQTQIVNSPTSTSAAVPVAAKIPVTVPTPTAAPGPSPTASVPTTTAAQPDVATPNLTLAWDTRLNDLGISLTRAQADYGQAVFRLVSARFLDEQEANGLHHVFVEVLDEQGQRILGQPVALAWKDGKGTMITEDKPAPEYAANAPLYGAMDKGTYEVYVEGAPSDKVSGLGLPGKHHVSYQLVFQRSKASSNDNLPTIPTQPSTPTPSPTATPIVNLPTGDGQVIWDPRLDDLGITLTKAQPEPGEPVYRLVAARYQDDTESNGLHHVFVEVLDEQGQRILGQAVTLAWGDGKATMITEDKPAPEYAANAPLYGMLGEANYSVYVEGAASDKINQLGLPGKHHVNYLLTFQRKQN